MSLLAIIATFVVVGLVLWLINKYIPMAENIKSLMNIAVIILLVIWLAKVTGLLAAMAGVKV